MLSKVNKNKGFALPIAIALGLVMLAFAGISILVAQNDRNNAVQRRTSGASLLVSDSAVARAMLQLSNLNNGVLLIRNYDPINPATGTNYLGADSVSKSGDETVTAVDEWTGYNPTGSPCFQQIGRGAPNIALTGTIGTNETYTIRAYRYDKQNKSGTLLVEGNYQGQSSLTSVTVSIEPVLDDFPGVLVFDSKPTNAWNVGVLALRGRQILGSKGNVYYNPAASADPSLTGLSQPSAANRSSYLNAVWSSAANDGASSDTITGKIFACRLTPSIPAGIQGTNLGVINTDTTLIGTGGTTPTHYQVDKITLANDDTLTVNTTSGPVYIDFTYQPNAGGTPNFTLRNTAKVINVRKDGQPPRVGDLRINIQGDSQTILYDQTCIQNAFLYSPEDELRILTSGSGCPGGKNTNVEGVVWAEAVLSSKNAVGNRDVNYLNGTTGNSYDTTITSGATSGLEVPDDLTSLSDLLDYVDWPGKYKYGAIKNWQRVN
jgi:hypothetical protein